VGAFLVEADTFISLSLSYCKMARITNILESLNTLILCNVDNTIQINKDTLLNIRTYLQNAQEKIEFLQLKSQLQHDELQQKSHDSELVHVQNNSLSEYDSHQ